jgi:hypothetical protein
MGIPIECICGNRFEADEAQAGQTVKCVNCASLHRVHGPRQEVQFARVASPLPYRSGPVPQAPPIDLGEALARIGWRIAAGLALAIQGLRLAESAAFMISSGPHGPILSPIALVGLGCGSVIAVVVAFRLFLLENWARWAMLVFGLIQAVVLVFIGQTTHPPAGPIIWYVGAAAMAASWVLLLERPTNRIKLTVGVVLGVIVFGGMSAVALLAKS